MSIFLSYRREDSGGYTGRLYDGLTAHFGDDEVFMDLEDIQAGKNFRSDVEQTSSRSDVVLVVIGGSWSSITDAHGSRRLDRDDDVLRLEVRTALSGPARVIPTLVDRATMPAPSDLPADLAPLCDLNAVELTDRRWRIDLRQLIAQIEQVNRQPHVGELVAGYRVEAIIREGRFGTVFRATEASTGDEVALRVITGSLALDPSLQSRVLAVRHALAEVESRAILKPRAAALEGERLFIVTDLLDGTTVRRVLARRGRLPVAESMRIALEVAEGLAPAHEKGLAHGGIGPSNGMLLDDAEPPSIRIVDFQLTVGEDGLSTLADVARLGRLTCLLVTGHEDAHADVPEPWQQLVREAIEGHFPSADKFASALTSTMAQREVELGTMLHERYSNAVEYARCVHDGDVRKGTSVPYLSHLLGASALVLEDGGSEDEAIAGLLHDAAEDHGGAERLRDIELRFGPTVARIVRACSDTLLDPKPPWRERKEGYIEQLRSAAPDELRVSLADKLHNARAILRDLEAEGASFWLRFTVSDRDQQVWYYRALADVFLERCPGGHARALDDVVARIEDSSR